MHSSRNSNSVITLDIETIPTQIEHWKDYFTDNIKPPKTLKKPESIAKWHEEEKEGAILDALEGAAFDGATNHIICIGWAINDNPPMEYHLERIEDEAAMLKAFYDTLGATVGESYGHIFVGHNINAFDLRVLRQRSMILRVQPPAYIPFQAKPWEKNPFDTMTQWCGARDSIKLDKLARAFDLKGKSMDGSQVYKMWRDGKFAEIGEYCKADVALTREIYKRMEFLS